MGEIKVPEPSTVSMGMVEKAKGAVWSEADRCGVEMTEGASERIARAAIGAMLEPSSRMRMEGEMASAVDDIQLTRDEIEAIYTTMIRAALSEGAGET